MKEKIIEAIEKCRSFDSDWDFNYDNLKLYIPKIHPYFYELSQSCIDSEVIYDKIINYKPLVLNPKIDKQRLKKKYELVCNIECFPEEELMAVICETIELSFQVDSFYEFIFCIEELYPDREELFTFEEFYQLWLDKKLN
jgi:hypothetical protein